jgi:exoribonuclease-2
VPFLQRPRSFRPAGNRDERTAQQSGALQERSSPRRRLGDKLEIELEDGRSLRVRPKDVAGAASRTVGAGCASWISPPGEVEAACELLEGEQTTLPDLAELVYGAYTPATAWAAWRLVDEGLYFQGTPEAIDVRPLAEVARERARARRKRPNAKRGTAF